MRHRGISAFNLPSLRQFWDTPVSASSANVLGRKLVALALTVQGLIAFALITLGVLLTKFGTALVMICCRVRHEIFRAGQTRRRAPEGPSQDHHAILRTLAFTWMRVFWKRWQSRTPDAETR